MDAQGTGEEHEATTQDRQGTGPPVKAGRGGAGVRLMDKYRVRKGTLYGRTLGPTGTSAQVEDSKRGQLDGVRQARLA